MSAELTKANSCTPYWKPKDCSEHFDPLEGQILDSTRSQLPPVFLQQFSALCIDKWAPSVHHKSLAVMPCDSVINSPATYQILCACGIPFSDSIHGLADLHRSHLSKFQARVWDMQLHILPNSWDLFLAEVSHSQHIRQANTEHRRDRCHGDHVHGQEIDYGISTKGPDSEPSKNP